MQSVETIESINIYSDASHNNNIVCGASAIFIPALDNIYCTVYSQYSLPENVFPSFIHKTINKFHGSSQLEQMNVDEIIEIVRKLRLVRKYREMKVCLHLDSNHAIKYFNSMYGHTHKGIIEIVKVPGHPKKTSPDYNPHFAVVDKLSYHSCKRLAKYLKGVIERNERKSDEEGNIDSHDELTITVPCRHYD